MLKPIATSLAVAPLALWPGAALAADGATTGSGGGGKGGMPQLDPTYYASQTFWLAVTFILFLLICWKVALPRIGRVLDDRRQKIEGDLAEARSLRDEAEKVLADYEAAVAEARSNAQSVVRQTAVEAQERAAKEHEKLGGRLAEQVNEAEARIARARTEAVASVKDVAGDLARTAAAKLLDSQVSQQEAEAAVQQVAERRN